MQMQDLEFTIRHSRRVLDVARRSFEESDRGHEATEDLFAALGMVTERLERSEAAIDSMVLCSRVVE